MALSRRQHSDATGKSKSLECVTEADSDLRDPSTRTLALKYPLH